MTPHANTGANTYLRVCSPLANHISYHVFGFGEFNP